MTAGARDGRGDCAETEANGPGGDRVRIEQLLEQQDPKQLREAIRQRLMRKPRELPSKLFYDDRGSQLFERICDLPEYYQTRTERALLLRSASSIVELSGAGELVELGSGAATKTRVLLDAIHAAGRLRLYVPFDFNEAIVRRTAHELVARYPGLRVHGMVADFIHHLGRLPDGGQRLVAFLGGTIGNLAPSECRRFLGQVSDAMESGDHFLLGVDLVKDVDRLEAAYNDQQGVTADFNKNILSVVNRLADADFNPECFEHRAIYNRELRRIEMWLMAREPQQVLLRGLALKLELAADEGIRTEISAKFDRDSVSALLTEQRRFQMVEWYTDPEALFGLALARKS
jgi:L-histidine N-alpha-methyltransferase